MFFQPPTACILSVPHVQQRQAGECLAACAAMICNYLNVTVDYARLVRLLEIQQDVGVSFSKIHKLEKLGLTTIYRQGGTLQQLYDLLAAGWPVIISIQTKELPYWHGIASFHAVVLVGMDRDWVYLNDPDWPDGPIQAPIGDFDLAWLARGERFALLAPST